MANLNEDLEIQYCCNTQGRGFYPFVDLARILKNKIMTGHIKLYRKIIDWEWYEDNAVFRTFMHLLLTANWKDSKWRGETVKRGQVITSYRKLADKLLLSEMQIRTALEKLESTNDIIRSITNKYQVITVCNYDTYQNENFENNRQITIKQQSKNGEYSPNDDYEQKLITGKQQGLSPLFKEDTENHKQANNRQITGKQQANNNQITTDEEGQEFNKNNIYISRIFEIWNFEMKTNKVKKINDTRKRKVNARLKEYGFETLKQAIVNYAKILQSNIYYWSYAWTIQDFMKSENVEKFIDWETADKNYRRDKSAKQSNTVDSNDYDMDKLI